MGSSADWRSSPFPWGLTLILAFTCMEPISVTSAVLCTSGNWTCDDGGCVDDATFCDGVNDCIDASDEKYCFGKDEYADYNFDAMFLKRPDSDREKESELCALGQYPADCKCKDSNHLYCEDSQLPAVPFGIPGRTTVLDLSGNKINTISQRDFETLVSLEKLIIMHSELKLILPGTFRRCKHLREVYLSGNEISDLSDSIFPEDNIVEILDLRLNRLRILTPDYFKRLYHLKKLYLPNNIIENIMPSAFAGLPNLLHLNLDGNNLQKIDMSYFSGLTSLRTLRLARNRIYYTEDNCFVTLISMNTLDLSNNLMRKIPVGTFSGLWNLTHLDLHQNEIVWIEENAFSPLTSLVSLNVRQNNFRGVDKQTFGVLPRLQHIYFDTFYMCAYAIHVSDCQPEGDGISSRYNLLENAILRGAVWVVAVLACFGNVTVFMGRTIVKDDNAVHSFLIKNLSLADLLMGVYLLVLATHDLRYRGSYLSKDKEWRDSWGCDVIGILATISNESSVLTLAVITLDRYICILYPLKMRRRTVSHAYVVMLVIWVGCLALAVLPVLGMPYFGGYFYRNNAVCVPLFLHDPTGHGWEYSAFLFLGINSAAFFFIVYAYAAMFLAIRRSRLMYRPADESQERCLMKRFFFIVVTDLFCWMPIILLKVAALAGTRVSGDLYGWLVVFVLPVNAALNPLLYTLTTRLFKQRLLTGLASAVWRRRSLETNSTSNVSFSSLKSRASCPRSERDLNDLAQTEQLNPTKTKGGNVYTGKMKYMYSHGRVIYPPGKPVAASVGYKPVAS